MTFVWCSAVVSCSCLDLYTQTAPQRSRQSAVRAPPDASVCFDSVQIASRSITGLREDLPFADLTK